jgi:hypothetical protein
MSLTEKYEAAPLADQSRPVILALAGVVFLLVTM